jgi:hypothetical protein
VIMTDENPASLSLCSPAHTHTLTTHTPFNSQNNLLYSFFWVFSALLPFFHLHHTPSHLHACFLSFSSPYSSPLPSSSSSRNPLPPNPPSLPPSNTLFRLRIVLGLPICILSSLLYNKKLYRGLHKHSISSYHSIYIYLYTRITIEIRVKSP